MQEQMPVVSPFLAICAALTEAQGHGTIWRYQCGFRSLFSEDRPIDWSASQGLFRGLVCKQEKGLESLRCSSQITAAGNADGIRGFGLFRVFERWSQIKPLTQKVESNSHYS